MKIENFVKSFKKEIPDIRPGDEIRIYQKIPARLASQSEAGKKEGEKSKIKNQRNCESDS